MNFLIEAGFLFTASVGITDAVFLLYGYIVQSISKSGKALRVEGIKDVLALPPVIYNPGLNQHPHIMGECGLGDVESLQYFAGAQFAAGEHIHNAQALWFRNGPQYFSCIKIYLFQAIHLFATIHRASSMRHYILNSFCLSISHLNFSI